MAPSVAWPVGLWACALALFVVARRRIASDRKRRWLARGFAVGTSLLACYVLVESAFVLFVDRTHAFAETLIAKRWIHRHAGLANSLGFRDRAHPQGPVPIAVLGDSFVWGFGIAERGDRVTERLEADLVGRGIPTRVANWSEAGAGTRREIELLEEAISGQGRPRVLVHVYVWNDLDFAPAVGSPRDLEPPWLLRPLVERSYAINFFWFTGARVWDPAVARLWKSSIASYRDPALVAEHARDLSRLRGIARDAGARYVAVGWPFHLDGIDWDDAYETMGKIFARDAVDYLDLRKTFAGIPPRDLAVWAFDPHPNERAHALAAAAIAEHLAAKYPDAIRETR